MASVACEPRSQNRDLGHPYSGSTRMQVEAQNGAYLLRNPVEKIQLLLLLQLLCICLR